MRPLLAAGVAGVVGIVLTGCASTDTDGGGDGGGALAAASSKTEYQEAFADIDPITMRTQSVAPKGSLTGARYEEYAAALEEWSDGKIQVEMEYSSAIAPPVEWDDALADGRLDFGPVAPLYEPSEYPVNDRLVSLLFLGSQLPESGYLELTGWANEVGLDSKELTEEYQQHGMHLLLPAFTSGSTGLFCSDSGADLASLGGRQVSVGSSTLNRQVSALGMKPASVDFTELFDSLQRGVIDCAGTTPLTLGDAGGIPAVPHLVLDPEVGFSQQAISFAVSDATWEKLPLIARQLMFDRLDIFLANTIEATWGQMAKYVALAQEEGGGVSALDDDARAALAAENEAILDDIGQSGGTELVEAAQTAIEQWGGRIDDLGFTTDAGYVDFAASYDESTVDLSGYTDVLLGEVLAAHRPQ